jgi:hypothetical protein
VLEYKYGAVEGYDIDGELVSLLEHAPLYND